MKIIISVILFVFLSGCNEEKNIMKIKYYSSSEERNPRLSEEQQKEILNLVTDLISNSNDILKLLVDEIRIEEIKQNETAIELIFEEYKVFTSDDLGTDKVKKLFFPLSGDFIGNDEDPVITIFLGDESYFSGPYRNENGLETLNKIKALIEKEI
jgi:hypothetical protein